MEKSYRRILLSLVILLIIIAIFYLENQKVAPELAGKNENFELKEGKYPKVPELQGITAYLNTNEIKISDFKGKIVLIDFWTYSCINCIRTLPHLKEWHKKYKDLVIIGVHTPEFEFEKDIENVKMAVKKYEIGYPVVLDNDYATWSVFRNRYWPRKFLIDSEGFIRFDHIGEGAYEETEMKIRELLSEIGKDTSDTALSEIPDSTPVLQRRTPELYAGYDFALPRGQNIGNREGIKPGELVTYEKPEKTNKDVIYLEGPWISNPDNLQSQGRSSIIFDFTASSANIVASSQQNNVEMEVLINDKYIAKEQAGEDVRFKGDRAVIEIKEPRLYNIVDGNYGDYKLTLKINSKEFSFNAFTFG